VVASKSLVAAALLALVLAASAAADDHAARDDYTVRIDPGDQAWVTRTLLKASDFGIGWRGGLTRPSPPKSPDCPGFAPNVSDLVVTGHAGANFYNPRAKVRVEIDAQVLASGDDVRKDFARTIRAELPHCLEYEWRHSPAKVVSVAVERLEIPRIGTLSAAYRATVVVRTPGGTDTLVSDYLFIGTGRLEHSLNIIGSARYRPQLLPFEIDMAKLLVRRGARSE
jgi:hypothetical protein